MFCYRTARVIFWQPRVKPGRGWWPKKGPNISKQAVLGLTVQEPHFRPGTGLKRDFRESRQNPSSSETPPSGYKSCGICELALEQPKRGRERRERGERKEKRWCRWSFRRGSPRASSSAAKGRSGLTQMRSMKSPWPTQVSSLSLSLSLSLNFPF